MATRYVFLLTAVCSQQASSAGLPRHAQTDTTLACLLVAV
jgi:hypothetical protein